MGGFEFSKFSEREGGSGEGGFEPPIKFSERGELPGSQFLEGGC